jgi:ferredoxin-type protein NapH
MRWLLARRACQSAVLLAFALAPPQLVSGNLAASLWFGALPLTDPFTAAQALLAGHRLAAAGIVGVLLAAAFFALVGGRLFCAWICPINMVTDLAAGLRRRLGLRGARRLRLDRRLRHVVALAVLGGSAAGGVLLWEAVNPITLLQRSLALGTGIGLWLAATLFLFDLLLLERGWCGHLCPVGAFYGWLGRARRLEISVRQRGACTDCGRCFRVCPEPQIIAPALRRPGAAPQGVDRGDCTLCGRCLEVCEPNVFALVLRPSVPAGAGLPLPRLDSG